MSNTIPLPQPDAYEYLIADVWRTQTHWNGVKASAYRCLYATEKVHAHAAAVSAADNAALRAELLQEHADHKETVEDAMQSVHANATLRERIKVLEDALRHVERVMGPTVPPCCNGCAYEWGEALQTVREALGDKT